MLPPGRRRQLAIRACDGITRSSARAQCHCTSPASRSSAQPIGRAIAFPLEQCRRSDVVPEGTKPCRAPPIWRTGASSPRIECGRKRMPTEDRPRSSPHGARGRVPVTPMRRHTRRAARTVPSATSSSGNVSALPRSRHEEPFEPDAYSSTAPGEILDRTLHAITARFTAGLSPLTLICAYLDWTACLSVVPAHPAVVARRNDAHARGAPPGSCRRGS